MANAPEPQVHRSVVIVMIVCGLAIFSLAVSAETTRAKSYTYLMDYQQQFHCHYPTSGASTMAFTAALLLAAVMGVANYLPGCLMCLRGPRYAVGRLSLASHLLIVFAWLSFVVSFTLLILGGVENQYHTQETTGGFTELKCSIVRAGTFAVAACFGVLCTALAIAYYVVGMKVRWELWRTASSYSSTSLESEIGSYPKGSRSPLPPVPEEKA